MSKVGAKVRLPALLLGMAVCLPACQTSKDPVVNSPPAKPLKPAVRTDLLAVGDMLEVFVMEDPSFNGTYKIREKGDIILPKLGRIFVAGITIENAQAKIKGALESSQLKLATVIADRSSVRQMSNFGETPKLLVFITGKVNRPGQHLVAVTSGDTVYAYEAVLIAGGVTPYADEKHAYILRRGDQGVRQKIPLDLRSIRQGHATDLPLVEGDLICVPERRFAL